MKLKTSIVYTALSLSALSLFSGSHSFANSVSSSPSSPASSLNSVTSVQNPAKFLSDFVSRIKHQISENQASLSGSPDKLYTLVQQDVLPNVALDDMAGMALGPKWREASPQVREEFITQFAKMVTRNYSAGLLKVSDYTFKIYPIRDGVWAKEQRVSINGVIQPNNGQAGSNVTYYLERSGQTWKIYDLAVEGVSFVSSYRSQFESYSSVVDLVPALKALNERST
jgi:phospholipid transport system substrate-binding protein